MLEYNVKSFVIILFMLYYNVKCESCVTYDFEFDFYNSFTNDNLLCNGFPRWIIGNYSSLDVERPSAKSEIFIQPNEFISCVSSFGFEMESTGVVEAYVYMESASQRDQLVVLAHEALEDGSDAVRGTALLTPLNVNFHDGWHVLRIILYGVGSFHGYVSFLGSAAEASTVIVDSFRYIPPSVDEMSCEVYGDVAIIPPITLEPECVAFSFEQEFDVIFDSDRGICSGLTSWTLNNYTSLTIESPSANSEHFITPSHIVSCVSSFPFLVEAGGIIEVNVYMESISEQDQIGIITNEIVPNGFDATTGSAVITPLSANYVDGWHTLTVTLSGNSIYEGYVSFLGIAAEDSIVLIDSFRYIPPSFEKRDCRIYEDEIAPVGNGDECVTYNFETDFDSHFDTVNQLCNGYNGWHLGSYSSLDMESFNPVSTIFVAPNATASCISSFQFAMKPGGTVEVNVYMDSVSPLDFVIILAKKVVPNGIDTVAGFELYYASNENFVQGWNVLKVGVMDFNSFVGYITLIGSISEHTVGLIDSFRYIPPGIDVQCEIY